MPYGVSRRAFFAGTAASLALAGYAAWSFTHPQTAEDVSALSVETAHRRAITGSILLIDVRRPDEWARTGVGEGALPLDMRRPDFISALEDTTGGDKSRPIALICARGVRSARMTHMLSEAGYMQLIDVPEGMLGSSAGAGWLSKGLPVVPVS